MVARRRRAVAMTRRADEPNGEVSGKVTRNASDIDESIPDEPPPNPTGVDSVDIENLDSEEEGSESNESDGDSVQVLDPTPDDAGYSADAEDGDDKGDEEEDENDEEDLTASNKSDLLDDHTVNANVNDESDESAVDDHVAVRQAEPTENGENEVTGDTDEGISDGEESREETDEREPVTHENAPIDEGSERMSEDEGSDDEASLDPISNVHNQKDGTDEGTNSAEEVDEGDSGIGTAQDPREEEELSDEQEDGSEDDNVVENVPDGHRDRRSEHERDSDIEIVLDQGDAKSPAMYPEDDADNTDTTEERASEGEEIPREDDIAQPVETEDNRDDSEQERGWGVEGCDEEASNVEPVANVNDDSDLGDSGEERTSEGEENEENHNTRESPTMVNETPAETENMEEQVSESEVDDDNMKEEEEGIREEQGDATIATAAGKYDDQGSGKNSTIDEIPEEADDIANSANEAEKGEEQVFGSESDDDSNDDEEDSTKEDKDGEEVAIDDRDDEGSEDMEDSDDDDVNTREYKLVPPMASAVTTSEPADKAISNESTGTEQEKDGNGDKKKTSKRIGQVEMGIQKPISKSGVIYLPRIPPGLDVTALRSLLSRITQPKRIWLRPETKEQRRRRQSLGGSRRKERFRDGWVELQSSKEARRVVGLLNGRPMTAGKRKGRWAEDLWCLKYLKGFGWDDLTKEVFGGRERVLRVRESVMQGRRERAWIEGRRKGGGDRVRRFRQKRVLEDLDDVRAREAGERVDQQAENGGGGTVDSELAGMLFKRRKT